MKKLSSKETWARYVVMLYRQAFERLKQGGS